MEGKEQLPRNSVREFYEVYPERTVKQLVIDTANNTIGFLSTDDAVDPTSLVRDSDGRLADHAVIPVSYIEVPFDNNTVLASDIKDAVDQLPDDVTVNSLTDFMSNMLENEERYIGMEVRGIPNPMELLMGLLGAIVNHDSEDSDKILH